jgi:flagellum-specific peptidoglycan hydrolase FlgJ
MINHEKYVLTFFPFAKAAGERFGIDPLIILSQAALESGWGTSNLSITHHNFFGITASGSSNEFWKGKTYQANNTYKLKFRVYDSVQDGFHDFARLISSKYKAAAAAGHDYQTYAHRIAYSPYISENNGDNRESYKNNIIHFYEQIIAIAKKKALVFLPPLV